MFPSLEFSAADISALRKWDRRGRASYGSVLNLADAAGKPAGVRSCRAGVRNSRLGRVVCGRMAHPSLFEGWDSTILQGQTRGPKPSDRAKTYAALKGRSSTLLKMQGR